MADEADDVPEGLVLWLNTFAAGSDMLTASPLLSSPVAGFASLGDGVALFELLSHLAPGHFDEEKMGFSREAPNLILKLGNLRKLVSALRDMLVEEVL